MGKVALKEGKYIYCIIASKGAESFGPLGIGDRGDIVYAISFDDISAVVSESPIVSYAVSRENMLAHERAIEEVMKKYTVLPVRFGTIAKDEENIKMILEKEYGMFRGMLNKINDKKELGLKAMFKEDIIYKEILEKYDEIRRIKDAIASMPPEKTYYQRMELGKMVESALEKEKEIYKNSILSALSPLAIETKINNTYGERMIINAAFLVDRQREPEFDQKVSELDGKYESKIKFKYIGTLPPFNFVNLIIDTSTSSSFYDESKTNH